MAIDQTRLGCAPSSRETEPARNGVLAAHKWQLTRTSVEGEFGGKSGKVYTAKCMNSGCNAVTTFPVHPENFKGVSAAVVPPCQPPTSRVESPEKGTPQIPSQAKGEFPMNGKVGRPPDLERARYYEDNKSEILSDFRKLGKPETLRKWGIPPSRWRVLRKKWITLPGDITDGMADVNVEHNGHGNGHGHRNGNGTGAHGNGNGHGLKRPDHHDSQSATACGLLRRMAFLEGPTELGRSLRLTATLVEAITFSKIPENEKNGPRLTELFLWPELDSNVDNREICPTCRQQKRQ